MNFNFGNLNNTNFTSQAGQYLKPYGIYSVNLTKIEKDELNGKQRRELLEIAENTKDPKEAQKRIFTKLKDFGEDVAANIVANIMTNPQVWQNLGSLL